MNAMRVRDILDPRHVVLDVRPGSKREILEQLCRPIAETRRFDPASLVDVLARREETSSTAIADGIAIPHGKLDLGDEVVCGFGRSRAGVDFDSFDGKPTRIFFVLVSPESRPSLHLSWLAHLAVMLKNADFRAGLVNAESVDDVLAVLDEEEAAQTTKEAAARRTS